MPHGAPLDVVSAWTLIALDTTGLQLPRCACSPERLSSGLAIIFTTELGR